MSDKIKQCEASGGNANDTVCTENTAKRVSISLAPLDSTDMSLIRMWRNDYKIWRWCRQNDLISDLDQSRWFEKQSADPTIRMYKIVLSSFDETANQTNIVPIGVCGFTSIDFFNRRAEFSLYIAPAYQGRGFGTIGLSCLLSHGFSNLGFHLIWGEVFEGNHAMKIFEKLGFKKEGKRRDFYFKDGGFIDAYTISIKSKEWKCL